jgi:hypothetical protein
VITEASELALKKPSSKALKKPKESQISCPAPEISLSPKP